MAAAARALMVDGNRDVSGTAEYLEENGVQVVMARDADAALRGARDGDFDVVLLELQLPVRDGLSVCREIRTFSSVPIIFLTAFGDEADLVAGFELGADDHLKKPCAPRELLARIRAVVRRSQRKVGPTAATISAGPLTLHTSSMTATFNGRRVDVTSYEFAILRVLAERPGHIVTREELLNRATRSAEPAFDRSVDVRISRLRHKLDDDPKRACFIRTVRGVGYTLSLESAIS